MLKKLARYARLDPEILRRIAHRTVEQQEALTLIRARDLMVRLRIPGTHLCDSKTPASGWSRAWNHFFRRRAQLGNRNAHGHSHPPRRRLKPDQISCSREVHLQHPLGDVGGLGAIGKLVCLPQLQYAEKVNRTAQKRRQFRQLPNVTQLPQKILVCK